MPCSDSIDISQYVSASMVENPWAALEKQHQRQKAPPPAEKPPPSTVTQGPSIADALAGAVQVRCLLQRVCVVCDMSRTAKGCYDAVSHVVLLQCRMRKVQQLKRARVIGHGSNS